MARQKEFDQEKALRNAVRLFSQQGFAATSTDELMGVMNVGRQSMYDTFGDKRALLLRALEMYVTESVKSINAELEKSGSRVNCFAAAKFDNFRLADNSEADVGCSITSKWASRLVIGDNGRGTLKMSRNPETYANLTHRPQVAVKPIKTFFSDGLPRWDVPRLQYDMAFVGAGDTQKMEKRNLR